MCLWPGLARLWLVGEWTGLLAAVGFSAALNLLLAATFLVPGLVPAAVCRVGWLVLAVLWIYFVARTWRTGSLMSGRGEGDNQGLFLHAQGEYLRGHWHEAEALLEKLLRCWRADVDARMMLATLYRRTGRAHQARQQLLVLEQTAGADKWRFEIEQERRILRRLAISSEGKTEVIQSS